MAGGIVSKQPSRARDGGNHDCVVCFLTDARGWTLARYAIASFILSQSNNYDIVLTCDGWPGPDATDPLLAIARAHEITLKTVILEAPTPDKEPLARKGRLFGHITETTFRKMDAILGLLPHYARVVYADIDILFVRDARLHAVDLGGKSIGAVMDYAICGDDVAGSFAARSRANGISDRYFNSGLMDCPYLADCETGDQCIFNQVFTRAWMELPLDLNVQSAAWRHPAWYTAKIRHYTGGRKVLPVLYLNSDRIERRQIKRIARLLNDTAVRYPLWAGLAAFLTYLRQARMRKIHKPKLDRLELFIAGNPVAPPRVTE
jgi:hypothetical protein